MFCGDSTSIQSARPRNVVQSHPGTGEHTPFPQQRIFSLCFNSLIEFESWFLKMVRTQTVLGTASTPTIHNVQLLHAVGFTPIRHSYCTLQSFLFFHVLTFFPSPPSFQQADIQNIGLGKLIDQYTDQIGVGAYFLVCAFIYRTVSGFYLLFFSFFSFLFTFFDDISRYVRVRLRETNVLPLYICVPGHARSWYAEFDGGRAFRLEKYARRACVLPGVPLVERGNTFTAHVAASYGCEGVPLNATGYSASTLPWCVEWRGACDK